MRLLQFAAGLMRAAATVVGAQAPRQLVGTLERLAVPGPLDSRVAISPQPDEARAKPGSVAAADEKVWVGRPAVLDRKAARRTCCRLRTADSRRQPIPRWRRDPRREGTGRDDRRHLMGVRVGVRTHVGGRSPASLRDEASAFPDLPIRVGLGSTSLNQASGGQNAASPWVAPEGVLPGLRSWQRRNLTARRRRSSSS